MNHSPSGLLFSQCIDGFVKTKTAEGLSQRTVYSYELVLKKWQEKMGDKPIGKVTPADVRDHLAYLHTDYLPHTFARAQTSGDSSTPKLSAKTLCNHWITFKAFFKWAATEFKIINPMSDIPAPRYKVAPVKAFSKDEITGMIKACTYARETNPSNCQSFVTRRPSAKRDEAIILFLLDTGLRASELCHLKIGEVDMKTGRVTIKHGDEGGAKGGKGRTAFIGKSTRRVVGDILSIGKIETIQKCQYF